MKKFYLLFVLSFAISCEPVITFAQTCEGARNIYITENPSQGLIGIGWTNSIGDKAQSVSIDDVFYKDGNSSYSVWTGLSFINTQCSVWQSLGKTFIAGQTVNVTIREYCTYPVSENYVDANFSYTFKNNIICNNKTKKSHKN